MNRAILLFIGILFLAIWSCGGQSDYQTRVEQLLRPWDSNKAPGFAVSVVQDNKVVFKKAYGLANLEYQILNTKSTVFHAASLSKQFTAFAVLLLEAEGRLSMDDDVRTYIPELPDFGTVISLRHLANHSSGIRDFNNLLVFAGWRIDDVISKDQIFRLLNRQESLNFEPGEEFLYSNTNYVLLAEVVERVSGMSFSEFTEKNIFTPLGMRNSQFYDDHEKVVKNRAYSYYASGTQFKKSTLNFSYVGATSLQTTIDDLALWAMNFDTYKVGSPEIISRMNERAELNDGSKSGFALGQFLNTYRGLNTIQHRGGDAAYRSFLVRFPEQNLSIMILGNHGSFNPYDTAFKIADIYLENDFIEEDERPVHNSYNNTPGNIDPVDIDFSEYAGRYYSDELDAAYDIEQEGDAFVLKHVRLGSMTLKIRGEDSFEFDNWSYNWLDFIRGLDRKVTGLYMSSSRARNVLFEKIN